MTQVDLVDERARSNIDLYIPKRGLSDSDCSGETINLLAFKIKSDRLPLSFHHSHVRTTMSSQYNSTANHPSQGSSVAAGSTPTQDQSVITAFDIWDDKTEGECQQTEEVYDIPAIPLYEEMKLLPGEYAPDDCLFCEDKGRTVDVGPSIWTLLLCSKTNQWFKPYRTDDTYESEDAQKFRVCDKHREWILHPRVLESLREGPVFLADGRGWFSILFQHVPADSVAKMPQPSTGEADTVAGGSSTSVQKVGSSVATAASSSIRYGDEASEGVSFRQGIATVSDDPGHMKHTIFGGLEPFTYATGPQDQLRCSICEVDANFKSNVVKTADNHRSHPSLFSVYWDTMAHKWHLAYLPPQRAASRWDSMRVRGCGEEHKGILKNLAHSTRGERNGPKQLPHQSLPHLTLHLVTRKELRDMAKEQLGR